MYGLVNKALQDLILRHHGEAAWQAIQEKAGFRIAAFVSMEAYPDDITYKLVGAAADHLGQTPEALLEAFGEHWTVYTAKEGYGLMFEQAGRTLPEFLQNLNNLHGRMALLMPGMQPPAFHCTEVTEHSLVLHYHSHRQGLAPFVVGLLKGLGTHFGIPVQVEWMGKSPEEDHDLFSVRW